MKVWICPNCREERPMHQACWNCMTREFPERDEKPIGCLHVTYDRSGRGYWAPGI